MTSVSSCPSSVFGWTSRPTVPNLQMGAEDAGTVPVVSPSRSC